MKSSKTAFQKKGLWVRDKEKIRLVPFETITHIHHYNGLSEVRMGKELLKKLRMPLCNLEKMMPETRFFRTHRNYIINKSFVEGYNAEEPLVSFAGGQKIPVSRRKKKQFESFLHSTYSSI